MYSINLDYIFDKAYDFLLFFKYVWNFWILGLSKETYLASVKGEVYDGLRDRDWLGVVDETGSAPESKFSFLNIFKGDTIDSDGDGIVNNQDPFPHDPNNFSKAQLLEIYQKDLGWTDRVRIFFGFNLRDEDGDGLPDSIEEKYTTDRLVIDTDHDGLGDGEEVFRGYDPKSPDTDGDFIVDGRDAYPLDRYRSFFENDVDTDKDGVGDRFEKSIGTDINLRDTDGDGVSDGLDSYPLDPNNASKAGGDLSVSSLTQGLVFHIQNPVLSFLSDAISVLSLFLLPVFILVFLKWINAFRQATEHYYHMFHGAPGYFDVFAKQSHKDHHGDSNVLEHKTLESSLQNPHIENHKHTKVIRDEYVKLKNPHIDHTGDTHIESPAPEEYKKHPRWAIVEDYLSADREELWRIGILEADNLLADILRSKGYPGTDLGEMLMGADFKSINDAWEAHKIRNKIAHEGVAYHLSAHTAAKAYNLYKNVFMEFNVVK